MMQTHRFLALAGVAALTFTACGGGDDDALDLSPLAQEGRDVTSSSGCAACHGADGQGINAPPWVGLYGSTIELDDGTTVVADDEYLRESIVDPEAKRVAGYPIRMPSYDLTDDEIDAVIAYIRELSGEPDSSGGGG